jgi:hypothetical protein
MIARVACWLVGHGWRRIGSAFVCRRCLLVWRLPAAPPLDEVDADERPPPAPRRPGEVEQ